MLFVAIPIESNAQLFERLRNKLKKQQETKELTNQSQTATYKEWQKSRPLPPKITFIDYTGITLDNIWNDIWWGSDYVPPIYLDAPKTKSSSAYFSEKEYTERKAQEEGRDLNTLARNRVSNTSIASTTEIEEDLENENVEDSESEEDTYTEIPEEYNIWSNTSIDPYNVTLSNMKDTVKIDVSSYYPPGYKYVTSEFGPRWGRLHAGIDLKVYTGDTIYSAFDKGIVRIKRFNRRGYGNYVVVRHENGLETLYGHMSKVLVSEGDSLRAGDVIGLGGSTGRSSGSHLHFEVRYLGKPINPRDLIDFNNHKIIKNTLTLTKENFRYPTGSKKKSKKGSSASSSSGAKYVTVRKGDTLGAIARRNKTTVAKIKSLNKLKSNTINVGKRLRVR